MVKTVLKQHYQTIRFLTLTGNITTIYCKTPNPPESSTDDKYYAVATVL